MLRLRLVLDGERIQHAEPVIGYMHRGAEKLFEARDYRQIIMLANRHDWLSAFSNELGVVLAVERMLGMEVPERAVWTRTLLAELNRVLNHLMFLGSYPLELGGITPVFYAFREREELQHVMEEISGGRMHYMFNRVGGLKEDLPAGWLRPRPARRRRRSARGWTSSTDLVLGNEIFRGRTRGVGVLVAGDRARVRRERADRARLRASTSICGATSRTSRTGSCRTRSRSSPAPRATAWPGSSACWSRPTTRWTWRTPAWTGWPSCRRGRSTSGCRRCSRPPRAHTYAWTENPLGINGYYLVSKGEKTPYRLKLRSASYNNIQALTELLPGTLVADMVAILGSLFFVVGDIDK